MNHAIQIAVTLFFLLVSFASLMTIGKESTTKTSKVHVAFPLVILFVLWLGGFYR